MATIKDAVYALLSADAGFQALCSDRLYPSLAAQGCARPYAVYHRIGGARFPAMGQDAGFVEVRFQIDAYSETAIEAEQVMTAVVAALNRKGGTYAGIVIQDIYAGVAQDAGFDETTRLYRQHADFQVFYEG